MAVCALFLSRASTLLPNEVFSPSRIFSITLAGITVAAAIVVVAACYKGFAWKSTDPGHWFAFVAAWEVLDETIVSKFLLFVTGGVSEHNVPVASDQMLAVFNSVAFWGIAAILFAGLAITKWPISWRIPVAIHALDATNAAIWRVTSVAHSLQWLHLPDRIYLRSLPFLGILAIASLAVAIAIDIYKRDFRNWPHWAGLIYEFNHWYWIVRVY
jgi:hypothetical protein